MSGQFTSEERIAPFNPLQSSEMSGAARTANSFLSDIRMQDWDRQWRVPPSTTEGRNAPGESLPPLTALDKPTRPQGQDQPDSFREKIREIWRQNPDWRPDRPLPWSSGDRSNPVTNEQIARNIGQVCDVIDEQDNEPGTPTTKVFKNTIIDTFVRHEPPAFGTPGHEPWASIPHGGIRYEQVNRSFAAGLFSECEKLGAPILVSHLTRNVSGGAGGAMVQVLNGGIGSYAAYTAMRDAQYLSAADGPVGVVKYSLAVAADLGMSAAAFARMSGVGRKWATPTLALSYGIRGALGLLPDRIRPAE